MFLPRQEFRHLVRRQSDVADRRFVEPFETKARDFKKVAIQGINPL
jgi:hypothetical protein